MLATVFLMVGHRNRVYQEAPAPPPLDEPPPKLPELRELLLLELLEELRLELLDLRSEELLSDELEELDMCDTSGISRIGRTRRWLSR